MRIIKIIVITKIIVLMFAVSCVSPEEWHDKYENIVPGPVSNVKVENVNGGAVISYSLPYVKDLKGAKVVYSLTENGEQMERWASVESDTITLEGFGDTNERTVTIYTVHKSGNISEGVRATIKPLTPPVLLIRETLQTASTFGGIQVTWDNPLGKEIGIALYVPDSITQEMVLFDRYYSKSVKGKTAFRPFKAEEQNFRIEMFDRWQNYASDMETKLTPLREILIPGKNEQGMPIWSLFDDGPMPDGIQKSAYRCEISHHQENLPGFANCIDWGTTTYWYPIIWYWDQLFPDLPEEVFNPPFYFTLDMGKKAIYSRFLFTGRRGTSGAFHNNVPTVFNIWGCNTPKLVEEVECPHGIHPKGSRQANQAYWSSWAAPNGTDAWKEDGWMLLAQCQYLFSNGELAQYSANDVGISAEEQARLLTGGVEFDFNEDVTDAYRYLRFEILRGARGDGLYARQFSWTGVQFWGDFPDEE